MSDYKKSKTYQEFTELIQSLKKPEAPKLTEVLEVSSFNEEIAAFLSTFYDSPDTIIQRIGTMMNSIFTQQNNVFSISQDSLNDLVKADENHEIESTDMATYNKVMSFAFTNKLFSRLREPVRQGKGVKKRIGLYELSQVKILELLKNLMGEELCRAKKDAYIKMWDEGVQPVAEKTDEELEIERSVRERKSKQLNGSRHIQ